METGAQSPWGKGGVLFAHHQGCSKSTWEMAFRWLVEGAATWVRVAAIQSLRVHLYRSVTAQLQKGAIYITMNR